MIGDASDSITDKELPRSDGMTLYTCVAKDGSYFGPHLIRKRGFWIGKKGDEKYVEDFDAALKDLKSMDSPSWRRPNPAGNWGIVTGREWRTIKLGDISQ